MKTIATEEHFHGPYYLDYVQTRKGYPRLEHIKGDRGQDIWQWWSNESEYQLWLPRAINKMRDLGEGRIKEMDESGIDMQILSFTPGIDDFDAAEGTAVTRKVNEDLSEAVKNHPQRFAGLAALAMKDPVAAADELERAVKELGLKGAMIFPHVQGDYVDNRKYRPVFEKAVSLDVPLYIHPTHPSPKNLHMYSDYPELAGSLWGFAAETGHGVMRLMCSGIFDELPDLKIILGHLGEALPFWMWRLDNRMRRSSVTLMKTDKEGKASPAFAPLVQTLQKMPSQVLRENIYVTTSGMLWSPALLCTVLALGADHILFAVDHPMEMNQEAVDFFKTAPISESDREKILHLNAERLLRL
jgi:2,3-dihydroxybenzoate decarboxylase